MKHGVDQFSVRARRRKLGEIERGCDFGVVGGRSDVGGPGGDGAAQRLVVDGGVGPQPVEADHQPGAIDAGLGEAVQAAHQVVEAGGGLVGDAEPPGSSTSRGITRWSMSPEVSNASTIWVSTTTRSAWALAKRITDR